MHWRDVEFSHGFDSDGLKTLKLCTGGVQSLLGGTWNGERDYVVADLRPVADDAYLMRTETVATQKA